MRKPFKTTIDEDILFDIKELALKNNCNVNDILEKVLAYYFRHRWFNGALLFPDELLKMTLEEIQGT